MAPYHPSSNGLAERAVQSFKQGIKRIEGEMCKINKFLFKYRIMPHSTTGVSPSELLIGYKLRCRINLLHPDLAKKVEDKQGKQKKYHDNTKPLRVYSVGDLVYAKNFSRSSDTWLEGQITRVSGPLSYVILLDHGGEIRRHVDHIRRREVGNSISSSVDEESGVLPLEPHSTTTSIQPADNPNLPL